MTGKKLQRLSDFDIGDCKNNLWRRNRSKEYPRWWWYWKWGTMRKNLMAEIAAEIVSIYWKWSCNAQSDRRWESITVVVIEEVMDSEVMKKTSRSPRSQPSLNQSPKTSPTTHLDHSFTNQTTLRHEHAHRSKHTSNQLHQLCHPFHLGTAHFKSNTF